MSKRMAMLLLAIPVFTAGSADLAESSIASSSSAETRAFIKEAERKLETATESSSRATWVHQTFINEDTKILAGEADNRLTRLEMELARRAVGMSERGLSREELRKLDFIRHARLLQEGFRTPAPSDPAAAMELAQLQAELDAKYGLAKACLPDGRCLDDAGVYEVLATSRDEQQMREVWQAWHDTFAALRPDFERVVNLSNRGARELGFKDLGELWRAPFGMPPEEFPTHVDQLWDQVKPLFEALHCHVREKLAQHYGAASMPADGTIPAHLVGEVSGTLWTNIFDLVTDSPGEGLLEDPTQALVAQGYDSRRMAKTAEQLFTSMGFEPLRASFWERSVLDEPAGREVQCIGSEFEIVPYTRYFLAQILQFQLFKRACELGGYRGPLYRCSLYGNKLAGAGLQSMMALGASLPWPDALERFTGTRTIDAAPMLEYFAPLRRYLDERNAGRKCLWKAGPAAAQ